MKKIESCDYIIIAGPTASGKSDLALELAKKINGSIINSDSIQIYKDLKILSARPNLSQTNQIKHYLYGFVDSNDSYSVGRWLTNVKETISDIKKQKRVPIFVGGTGLYLYILENGLSPIPDIPRDIDLNTKQIIKNKGNKFLYEKLKNVDSKSIEKINVQDTQRIIRAWNVLIYTEKTLSYWHTQEKKRIFGGKPYKIYVKPSRKKIYKKINNRFDQMILNGAIKEVANLKKLNLEDHLPIMKALGFKQISSYLNNKISKEECINLSKKYSRHYAKRQITWFNNKFEPHLVLEKTSIKKIKKILDKIL